MSSESGGANSFKAQGFVLPRMLSSASVDWSESVTCSACCLRSYVVFSGYVLPETFASARADGQSYTTTSTNFHQGAYEPSCAWKCRRTDFASASQAKVCRRNWPC